MLGCVLICVRAQGCNSALESARVLADVYDRVGGDLSQLPAAYNAVRLPDAHAVQYLEYLSVSWLGVGWGLVGSLLV